MGAKAIRRRDVVLSRRQIEGLIAQGRQVIVVDGNALKVDAWIPYHPGGQKAIQHMVGRDATDEVTAYGSHLGQLAFSKLIMTGYILLKLVAGWIHTS